MSEHNNAPAVPQGLERYEPTVMVEESRGRLTATCAVMKPKEDGRWVRLRDLTATPAPAPALAALSQWGTISEYGEGAPNHGDIVLCEMEDGQTRHTINFGFEIVQWDENTPLHSVTRWLLLNRMPETQADFLEIDRLQSAPAPAPAQDATYRVDDEAQLLSAIGVMNDVLTDIGDWEDQALADAVKASKRDLEAMVESIRFMAEPAQEPSRPQNCGTSYCSCIECVCEPAQVVGLTDQEPSHVALLNEGIRALDAEHEAHEFFESENRDSYGFKRSVRGTYVNGAVARDWKWFQLGIHHATKDLP